MDLSRELLSAEQVLIKPKRYPLMAERLDVHDWVDHCLFGRAPTRAGDSLVCWSLDGPMSGDIDTLRFIKDHTVSFERWREECEKNNKTYNLGLFFDHSNSDSFKYDLFLYTDIASKDFEALLNAFKEKEIVRLENVDNTNEEEVQLHQDRFSEAYDRFDKLSRIVNHKIYKHNIGEILFTAARELALAPWVKQTVEALSVGEDPLSIPESILNEIGILNEMKQSNPDHFADYSDDQIEELETELVAIKKEIYTLASELFQKAASDPDIKNRIIALSDRKKQQAKLEGHRS